MTGSRTLGALVAVVALIALAAAIFVFSGGGPTPPAVATGEPPSADITPAQPGPTPTPVDDEGPAVSREQIDVEEADGARSPHPASYREHLAGITGRVVLQDGTPVPDFAVELFGGGFQDALLDPYVYFSEESPELQLSLADTRTGKDGRFLFRDVDPRGMFVLGLDLEGPRADYRFMDDLPGSQEVRDIGDVRLKGFITFRGQVVDLDGVPVPDARVRATDLPAMIFEFGVQNIRGDEALVAEGPRGKNGREPSVYQPPRAVSDVIRRFPIPTTTTDTNGEFVLPGVPYGVVTVLVDKKDFITLVHGPTPSGAIGSDRSIGTLTLDEGDELTGRVETTNGTPIAGAEVMVGPALAVEEVAIVWPTAKTDSNGRFHATGLSLDTHVVAAREKDGIDWQVVRDAEPGGEDVVIVFPETLDARITAVAPSGEIVPKPDLLLRDFGDNGPGEMPIFQPPRRITTKVRYDEDGSAIVSGLREVRYKVLVRAEGYAALDLDVDLRKEIREFRAELPLAHSLSVQVHLDADQTPVEHAAVAAISRKNEILDEMPVSTARTDVAGSATLSGMPEGEYQIRVDHPGYAVQFIEIEVPADPVEIPLFMGGSINGRVHRQGQPPDMPRFIALVTDDRRMIVPRFTVTDLEGGFEFHRVSPGKYEVTVMKRFAQELNIGEMVTSMFSFGGGPDFLEREVETAVAEGEQTDLDIDLMGAESDGPTAYLYGRVMLNGRVLEMANISAQPIGEWRNRRSARTDASGMFEMGDVAIGEQNAVRLSVVPADQVGGMSRFGGAFYSQNVSLQEHERREVILDIRAGEVRGRVLDGNGRAVGAAEVNLISTDYDDGRAFGRIMATEGGSVEKPGLSMLPMTRQSTHTEADGSFHFAAVPTRSVVVSVDADGFLDYQSDSIPVPQSGTAQPVQIVLTEATVVSGSVQLPDTQPATYRRMQFTKAQDDDGNTSSIGVNLTNKLTFTTDQLGAGEYSVTVMLWRQVDDNFEIEQYAGALTVPPQGVEGVVIPVVLDESGR